MLFCFAYDRLKYEQHGIITAHCSLLFMALIGIAGISLEDTMH